MKNEVAAISENDRQLTALVDNIVKVVREARESVSRHVNTTMVVAYWNVGRYIVEFEQQGSAKARYGTGLLANLSKLLSARLGRGYSRPNLNNMRKFYLVYPICQNISDKLNWSQICELITITDPLGGADEAGRRGCGERRREMITRRRGVTGAFLERKFA